LDDMMMEYESALEERKRLASIKWYGDTLLQVVSGIQRVNSTFDPFDIDLDGWSEQIEDDIENYDDIFEALHERYKEYGSSSPELQLLWQVCVSGMMVHASNRALRSSFPGADEIMRQHPDLAKQFQSAAVQSMSKTNPGYAGLVQTLQQQQQKPSYSQPIQPAQDAYRPPLHAEAQSMLPHGNGVLPPPIATRAPNHPAARPHSPIQQSDRKRPRPEMKGPSDIGDLLSGLKTGYIRNNPHPPATMSAAVAASGFSAMDTAAMGSGSAAAMDSNISAADMNDIIGSSKPKRSYRKKSATTRPPVPNGGGNTVSLDV
jgi:hypothetical protein